MSERLVSKYWASRSRTSSGSRDSDSVVNPTRSAKRTVTSRRSAADAGWTVGSRAGGTETGGLAATASTVPHSPQNFCSGGLAVPHDGHTTASAVPHSPQNFWPEGLSAEHRGQIILRRRVPCPKSD